MADGEAEPAIQPAQEVDDSSNEKIFDFFGLPPELRNAIYDLMTEEVQIFDFEVVDPEEGLDDIVIMEKHMLVKCLLLNRQFKDEYESQTQPNQRFIFKDSTYNVAAIHLPSIARKTSRFTFYLLTSCRESWMGDANCNCEYNIRYFETWMPTLFRQFKIIRTVEFKLFSNSTMTTGPHWTNHITKVAKRLVNF